jgi:hypothetical protein
MNETLRLNGTAVLTTDPEILAKMAVNGKPPRSALLVTIDQVFLQCAKALVRSKLWNPESRIERETFPTLGQIIADQVKGVDSAVADERIEISMKTRLY